MRGKSWLTAPAACALSTLSSLLRHGNWELRAAETVGMPSNQERLEVYQVALDFFDVADVIVEQLRHHAGRSNLVDQLRRAALSVVNHIAEGAGKISNPGESRFYAIAIGSATESAAMLDVCLRRRLMASGCSIESSQCSSTCRVPCATTEPYAAPAPDFSPARGRVRCLITFLRGAVLSQIE